jgi:hypothetical protein
MSLNRLLLRATLILLAIAAGTAVLAALTGSTTALWRVVFTCVEAAIAAGAIGHVSRYLRQEIQRPAAVVGFGTIGVSFAFLLVGTWVDAFGRGPQGEMLGTALAVFGLGAIATTALGTRTRADCAIAAPATAIAAGLTLALIVGAIWANSDKLGGIAAAAGPVLMVAMLGLIGTSPRERPWRFAGVLAGVAATAIGVQQVMLRNAPSGPWQWYAALTAATVAVSHANLLMLMGLSALWTHLRSATIAASAAAAIGVTFAAFSLGLLNSDFLDQPSGRFTAAAGILAACGTLALIARQRLGRRFALDVAASGFDSIHLTCPRCATKQHAPVGDSPCISCRMLLSVRAREPRCGACGYCLYDLPEDRCPECGAAIPIRGKALVSTEDQQPAVVV